jgi:hypothetical protein
MEMDSSGLLDTLTGMGPVSVYSLCYKTRRNFMVQFLHENRKAIQMKHSIKKVRMQEKNI